LFRKTRMSPQATSNAPTVETMATDSSFWKTEATSAAPVRVRIAQARTTRPVRETNPPNAIFDR
jgi:hypothetical protein